jgi:hypothetical protein
MSQRIHATVNPVQAPASLPMLDAMRGESDIHKLRVGQNAMLPSREFGERRAT